MKNAMPVLNPARPPLFVGAGIIRSKAQIHQFAAIPDLAAQIIGSYSMEPHGGNDPDDTKTVFSYDEVSGAAFNAIGLKNCGHKAASKFLPDAIKTVHSTGQVAIIAITSLSHEHPEKVLPILAEWALRMGADAIEINGSCPNEQSKSGVMCSDPQITFAALKAVRERIGPTPYIMLKVSALSSQLIEKYKTMVLPIDGVTVINNCRRLSPVDPTKPGGRMIEVNDGYAGQSGPIIRDLALENLGYWRGAQPDAQYDVWSIGGLDSGVEAYARVHDMGAVAAGGAQALYRSQDPARLVERWSQEYRAAASAF